MTLFKLSASNMKKSIKDYAIYFFTLVLGVAGASQSLCKPPN